VFSFGGSALTETGASGGEDGRGGEVVWRASAGLVVVAYPRLEAFLARLEQLGAGPADASRLRTFLDAFVERIYLPRLQADQRRRIARALDGPEAFRASQRLLEDASRPGLLEAARVPQACFRELLEAARAMPPHAVALLREAERVLDKFLQKARLRCEETLEGASCQLVLRHPHAAALLADFHSQRQQISSEQQQQEEERFAAQLLELEQQAYLGRGEPALLPDPARASLLAALSESADWLAERVEADFLLPLAPSAPAARGPRRARPAREREAAVAGAGWRAAEEEEAALRERAGQLRELARRALLALQLDLRARCHAALGQLARQSFQLEEEPSLPDGPVLELCRELWSSAESLSWQLGAGKAARIFRGLSHLLGDGLVSLVPRLPRLNRYGLQKLSRDAFALQQALAALQPQAPREDRFDRARRYFDLVSLPDEDLVSLLVAQGVRRCSFLPFWLFSLVLFFQLQLSFFFSGF
jgi:exocyst complex component 4